MGELRGRIVLLLHGLENRDEIINAFCGIETQEDGIGVCRIRTVWREGKNGIPSGRGQNINVYISGTDLDSMFV